MRFYRRRITTPDLASLRAVAARSGWYLENASSLRVGLGPVAVAVALARGLAEVSWALDDLRSHELVGEEGPVGTGVVAFAAMPFNRGAHAVMNVPSALITHLPDGSTWLTSTDDAFDVEQATTAIPRADDDLVSMIAFRYQPPPDEYAHAVARAVERLRRHDVDKVVLARSLSGTLSNAPDPSSIVARLRVREPACTVYSIPTEDGRRFVGATPELLVSRTGAAAAAHPLAGTIAVTPHTADDDFHQWLLGSAKNRHEHAVVATEVAEKLATVYDHVAADDTPSIVRLRSLAHLGTWIHASSEHEVDAPDALEVLRLLHPTAAVGGIPRDDAYQLIRELEPKDRGVYAGPLGWMDARGDGEWWVGFRGVLLDGAEFEAWAGAGIVEESDPLAEREETRAKLASVLAAVVSDSL